MSERTPIAVQHISQRPSAVLLFVGALIGLVGNALHPHVAQSADLALQAVAGSDAWVAIHLTIVVAILLVIGGLIGLAHELDDGPGGPLARLGVGAALLGGAVVTVSTAIDGFVMKPLALAWVVSPASDSAAALRFAAAVKLVDFGIWSIGMLVFFGVAFVCFGAAVALSGRFPARLGWVAVVAGTGSAVAAILQIANTGEVQAAVTLFLISSMVTTLWALALGVLLWRAAPAGDRLTTPEPRPIY